MHKKFMGQFDAITKLGAAYCNEYRFKPLHGDGKPLWEFKESDHRLYCHRKITSPNILLVVLLSGWIKQKKGKTDKEQREIQKAMDLYGEFLEEQGGR